uniref:Uncharacterized protein n=1 Tax=Trypanosoma congolense (strain IL3000) TaxID=1068625 RepID=G0UM27_TRYCI|nr:hypothetical protein, unlikely [Trypanosoma congolense IL3000]
MTERLSWRRSYAHGLPSDTPRPGDPLPLATRCNVTSTTTPPIRFSHQKKEFGKQQLMTRWHAPPNLQQIQVADWRCSTWKRTSPARSAAFVMHQINTSAVRVAGPYYSTHHRFGSSSLAALLERNPMIRTGREKKKGRYTVWLSLNTHI